MKELTIEHIAATNEQTPRVRVGYRAHERANQQSREAEFSFEFADTERDLMQWYLEEYLQCPWGAYKDRAAQAEATMQRLGEELFEAVFPAGSENRELYDNVRGDLANTRFVIHAADPTGVSLPWELLRDPKRTNCDLARLAHSFARSQPALDYDAPAPQGGTFNILLVICRPSGDNDVPFQSVARRLLSAVRGHRDRIQIDVLRPPTFEELARVLQDKPGYYQALHFDGHGVFPGGAMQGMLAFENEKGKTRFITGAKLGELMTQARLPLVVLNACQSGQAKPEATYASVGNQLLQAGVGAVVAMAYSVYVQSAAHFMARFYERLAQGDEVARAVHAGREELAANNLRFSPIGDLPLRDWIVPLIFEAAPVSIAAPRAGTLKLNLREGEADAMVGQSVGFPEAPAFGFIGRDDATQKLERAFTRENMVLLRGMAGVGKTSLAVGFAQWLAETGGLSGSGELQGAAFFTSFERYATLETVISPIGRAFNGYIKREVKQDWDQLSDAAFRRDIALQILRQTPCLLIWDNFEPVHGFPAGTDSDWTEGEQSELRDFLRDLRGGKTKVLLTSRRAEAWLNQPTEIYREVEIGGLRLSEAQELAVLVLERAGLDSHALKQVADYNDLLRFLRGNPLAIQAILPELKRRNPTELLADLQSGEAKLPHDDTQGRDRSLWASLNYRFEQLDPALRQRLAVLGLFQGFVNTHVLTAMSEQPDAPDFIRSMTWNEWNNTLGHAAEIGLLHSLGSGRYTLHPALSWFLKDLLHTEINEHKEWLEQAFCKAGCGVGRGLQEMSQSNPFAALCQLTFEETNLKHALKLCEEHQLWSSSIGVLDGLHILLTSQSRWGEWEKLVFTTQKKVTKLNGEPLDEAKFLWPAILGYQSRITEYKHNFVEKMKIDAHLGEHFKEIGDLTGYANSLHHQGICAEADGLFDEAKRLYSESASIHKGLHDEYAYAVTMGQVAVLAFNLRDLPEAEALIHQILPVFKESGDLNREAQCLHNLGSIYAEQNKLKEATLKFEASLNLSQSLGDKRGEALNLNGLGVLLLRQRKYPLAEDRFCASLKIAEAAKNETLQASILYNLGCLSEQVNRKSEAKVFYQNAFLLSQSTNTQPMIKKAGEALNRMSLT